MSQPPVSGDAVAEMERAVRCLALELPAAVHDDVRRLWDAVRAQLDVSPILGEVPLDHPYRAPHIVELVRTLRTLAWYHRADRSDLTMKTAADELERLDGVRIALETLLLRATAAPEGTAVQDPSLATAAIVAPEGPWHCRQIANGPNPIIVCHREDMQAEIDRLRAELGR